MADSGELSSTKLSMLLGLLGIIWVLCYMAELQLPHRHILDTIDRLQPTNVSKQSLEVAISVAKGNPEGSKKQFDRFKAEYGIKSFPQKKICVIISETTQQSSIQALRSVYQQQYSNFTVYHFYKNEQTAKQASHYVDTNALNMGKLKLIQTQADFTLFDQFLQGRLYCKLEEIIIFLDSKDVIIGQNVFDLINTHYSQKQSLKVVYSASIVEHKSEYRLGHSYPYPQDVIDHNQYRSYPFILGGLVSFRTEVYQKIQKTDLQQETTHQYFKYLGSIVYGIRILELSNKELRYIEEPLVIDSNNQLYITNNKTIVSEVMSLYSQKSAF